MPDTTEDNLTVPQQNVVARIRRLHETGESLAIEAVRENHPDLLRQAYRVKPFWGWKCALEAAGLDYKTVRLRVPRGVLCKICGVRRHNLIQHLAHHHSLTWKEYAAQYPEGHVLAACYPRIRKWIPERQVSTKRIVPHWEAVWSPEYILDRLAELHRQGHDLSPSVVEQKEIPLYNHAKKFFGGWDEALSAAGIEPDTVRQVKRKRQWTRKQVIDALQARAERGEPVNWTAIVEADRSLSSSALRHFGKYPNALRAANLDPDRVRAIPVPKKPYKTKEDVLREIRRRDKKGWGLSDTDMRKGEHRDGALYNKARRLFGKWRSAVEAAGVDYLTVTRQRNPYTTKKDVLDEIRRRHEKDLPLTSTKVRVGPDKNTTLYNAALTFFGTWPAAVETAGIDYKSLGPRPAKYPSPESVLAEIKRRHGAGLPLNSVGVCKETKPHCDKALFMKGLREFGSWRKAVEAAGIEYRTVIRRRKYQTKDDILRGIEARVSDGKPLLRNAVYRGGQADFPLLYGAEKEFGDWPTAVQAARDRSEAVRNAAWVPHGGTARLETLGLKSVSDLSRIGLLRTKEQKALKALRVRTVDALLVLDVSRVSELPYYGKLTRERTASVQCMLRRYCDGDDSVFPCVSADIRSLERFGRSMQTRTYLVLRRLDVQTIDQLLKVRERDVLLTRGAGKVTWKEIERLQRLARICRKADTHATPATDAWRNQQVSARRLEGLPLYANQHWKNFGPDDLHPSYHPHLSLGEVLFPPRALSVFEKTGLHTIGSLLLFPGERFLRLRNCGKKTLKETRAIVRRLLLNRQGYRALQTDMTSFNNMVKSFVTESVGNRRHGDVTLRRMLLNDGGEMSTLGDIAKVERLTRERIRQMENKARGELSKETNLWALDPLWDFVKESLAEMGSPMQASDLAERLRIRFRWAAAPDPRSLCAFLSVSPVLSVDRVAQTVALREPVAAT